MVPVQQIMEPVQQNSACAAAYGACAAECGASAAECGAVQQNLGLLPQILVPLVLPNRLYLRSNQSAISPSRSLIGYQRGRRQWA